MNAHTPGPWTASSHGSSLIVATPGGWLTSQVADCGADRHANARLMAAAPDLLEAARIGLACCIAWGGKCEAKGEHVLVRESLIKAETIRSAIAKAQGGCL